MAKSTSRHHSKTNSKKIEPSFELSENALKTMDLSMKNFKSGKISKPIKE